MTLYDVSKKMLTVNFRRYRLYFLCNVFSVALFYSFAAIFTNRNFMDVRIVDSMISSNIYAPSVLVGIFVALFVPYSNNAFLKNRKYEYGVLMTLGMSEWEAVKNILLEGCVIAGLSLISGLFLGTLISLAFYFIIHQIIGISALRWYFNPASYKITILLYGITMILTLLTGILGFVKGQLVDLIQEKFKGEKKKSLPAIFFTGLVLIVASVAIMVIKSKYDISNRLILSLGIMFVGVYMITIQMEYVEMLVSRIFPKHMKRHTIGISFVRQHNKTGGRLTAITAWLIGFSIFFTGLCVVTYPSFIKNTTANSPYDLVYSQIFKKNMVKDDEIRNILNQHGVSVKSLSHVEYLRNNAFNLLPASQVSKIFNCSYEIPRGKFLQVFQYDLTDGYKYQMNIPKSLGFKCGDDMVELLPAGNDVKILFNRNPTFADQTLVLNDVDYFRIASESKDYWRGTMELYNLDDWRHSAEGIKAVQNYLQRKNHVEELEQSRYYRATSRIEAYTTARQSAEFLIFIMFFVVVLFYSASNIIIHFKIKAEAEEEQRMLWGLYRVGVTAEEMLYMIKDKNTYYYIPQVMIGLFIGVFYNSVNKSFGFRWHAVMYSLLAGIALILIQMVVVRKYSKRELASFSIWYG